MENKIKMSYTLLLLLTCLIMQTGLRVEATTGQGDSTGSIGMRGNNEPDTAVDPIDNEEITTRRKATEGPYSIAYVSDLNFGTQMIPKKTTTFFALNDKVTTVQNNQVKEVANFIQIADSSGSENGWKLFVSSNDAPNSNSHSIEGAVYNFHKTAVKPIALDQNDSQTSSSILVPKAPLKVTANSKQQTLVAEATGLQGQGRWHVVFGNSANDGSNGISMTIPKGAVAKPGIYQSTLSWDFTNAK